MRGRWWRAYDEAVDDPKLGKLSDKTHRAWFNLCCITSQNGGRLPAIMDIAYKLRTTADKTRALITELSAYRLIDIDKDGTATMHNWDERQFQSDTSTPRVKRFRNKQRNVSRNVPIAVSETVPDTDTESDTERVSKKEIYTRAREAELLITREAESLSADCLRAVGIDPADPPPEWFGFPYQAQVMVSRGFDRGLTLATMARVGPNKPIKYHMKAVESAHDEAANKPAFQPEKIHERPRQRSAITAAIDGELERRLVERDRDSEVRENPPRLLSNGGGK